MPVIWRPGSSWRAPRHGARNYQFADLLLTKVMKCGNLYGDWDRNSRDLLREWADLALWLSASPHIAHGK
jgi:hypothetical protein